MKNTFGVNSLAFDVEMREKLFTLLVGVIILVDWVANPERVMSFDVYSLLLSYVSINVFALTLIIFKLGVIIGMLDKRPLIINACVTGLTACWTIVTISAGIAYLRGTHTIMPLALFFAFTLWQYYAFTRVNYKFMRRSHSAK